VTYFLAAWLLHVFRHEPAPAASRHPFDDSQANLGSQSIRPPFSERLLRKFPSCFDFRFGDVMPADEISQLILYIGGGDGVAGSVPDSQDPHVLFVLPDVKDDSVDAFSFAIEQVANGITKLFCLRNDRASSGNLFQAENSLKQTCKPPLGMQGGTSRMRSNAVYASVSAGAARLTR
jgi:hypothetical protein